MTTIYDQLSQERKELQEKGEVPLWYTTAGWQMFKEKYQVGNATVRETFRRISSTAASHLEKHNLDVKEWEDKFFELMWNGWLSCSTPVLANMGTTRGMSVSCSGQYIRDSVDGFYDARHEAAMLTKNGFGTSGYLGDIRPRGSVISRGGKASGVIPVIKGLVQDMRDIAQGTQRRGAFASYLPIEHGDFDEVCDLILHEPDDLNIGWVVTDAFVNKLKMGDKEATRRYQKAMKAKMTMGKGYWFFVDKANRKRPACYVGNNLDVKASNLCVAPETIILTSQGFETISELEGQNVDVWNGREWSNVKVVKTGENQELVTVKTSSGMDLTCTPYHKFYVKTGYGKAHIVEKRACELQQGDKLIKLETPVIRGEEELNLSYENGFYSGDGCCVDGKSRVYLYGEKKELFNFFENKSCVTVQPLQDRIYFYVEGLKQKFFVPDANYSVESRVKWFAGLLDADGCLLTAREGTQSLQICSAQEGFLSQVQLMLQTLGVQSKIVFQAEEGIRELPANDGTGEKKGYYCRPTKRLLIGATGILQLLELGMKCNRLAIEYKVPNRECSAYTVITNVEWNGRRDDTYCFTEPKRHMGVFNGLLTGQCSEIMLHSDEDVSYTCVLSSLNLALYDEWKGTDAIFTSTVFLDCVAEDFIQKGKDIKGLERAVRFTEKGRALGLGVCGFHSYVQKQGWSLEGFETHMWNLQVFKQIHEESLKASQWMAEALGTPEWCKGYGVRNSHRLAVAPTKSTALMMGGVSEGINPDPMVVYRQTTAAGEVDRITPVFLELLKAKGKYEKAVLDDIREHNGSVQHLDWLTDEEKACFRTAFEIDQKNLLRLASTRAKYIDQWQSLNLFFSADEEESYVSEVHQQAFEDENILALYYNYTMTGIKAAKDVCEACQ